uniref:isocitrate/isopropylmalate family dehydrogenase n=1 Tax=Promineifilum sp. TaxID=2664178 RepID=UPI0035B1ECC5
MSRTIVILDGDQTGQELLEESLRVLQQDVIRYPLEFLRFDLSLENRRATKNQVVYEAGKAIRDYRVGLKAATITPEKSGDVGSPNAILREEMDAEIILRTGRRIPGVRPVGGMYAPISIVRMARDDAYGAR